MAAIVSGCGDDPPKADRTPPVVTIDAPTNGLTVAADGLVVRGTVLDPKVAGEARSGVANVTVNGVEVALAEGDESRAFTTTLSGLTPGPLVIEVVAADAKGNLGSARVQVVIEDPVVVDDRVGIVIEPSVVLMERLGATARPGYFAYRSDAAREDIAALATLAVEDDTIATVASDGTITAVKSGTTRLIARLGDLEATARIVVAVDDTPPATPEISTYRPETSLRA